MVLIFRTGGTARIPVRDRAALYAQRRLKTTHTRVNIDVSIASHSS